MKQDSIRRAVAAVSATAMAGAALVVGGAGVASAAPTAPVTGSKGGVSYERTVSESSPVWGEEITITNKLTRGANWWLIYWIEDVKPDCLEYIPGSATWTVSGGTYTEGSNPNEVNVTPTSTKIAPPAANSWEPPINFSAGYRVTCAAGDLHTGGPKWNTTNAISGSANFSDRGPTINVKRADTSLFLKAISNPQLGETVAIQVDAPGVPNGGLVTFTADGQTIGTGVAADERASFQWTPQTTGTHQIAASFAQTGTHVAAISNVRPVTVSAQNQASDLALELSGTPKVGAQTRINAEVSPAGAGGTVDFKVDNVVIDTVSVGADGKVATTWVPSAAGEASIDASFSGRPGVNPSQAIGIPVDVAPADADKVGTTTVLDRIAATPLGGSIVLRAKVGPDAAGGTITFSDGSNEIATVPVGADGVATFEWRPETEGERTVWANFSGSGAYLDSQDSTQAVITPRAVEPEPDPGPDPSGPDSGSLGSLTGSGGGGSASGSLGSLSGFGS